MTLKLTLGGFGSTLPEGSTARTVIVCFLPLPGFEETFGLNGDLQVLNLPLSSLHWNVEPASFEVKVSFTLTFFLGVLIFFFGFFLIFVFGGVVSPGISTAPMSVPSAAFF